VCLSRVVLMCCAYIFFLRMAETYYSRYFLFLLKHNSISDEKGIFLTGFNFRVDPIKKALNLVYILQSDVKLSIFCDFQFPIGLMGHWDNFQIYTRSVLSCVNLIVNVSSKICKLCAASIFHLQMRF